jgi:putative endonuclease
MHTPRHPGEGRGPQPLANALIQPEILAISATLHTPQLRIAAKLSAMKGGWVYIMTNKPNGTLYTGITANLPRRIWQHREGEGSDFCRRYGLTRLVYAEHHDEIEVAIRREKQIKEWRRAWKIRLIHSINGGWDDLYDTLVNL